MKQYDYSETELEDAAEFRNEIHKEALQKAKTIFPGVESVIDRNPVETYFQNVWDYPGKWYLYVAIPEGYKSRAALIDSIVKDTVEHYLGAGDEKKPAENKKIDAPFRKEDNNYTCPDDPFYDLIAEYPGCVLDYCIVKGAPLSYKGYESHWQALAGVCRKIIKGRWQRCDVKQARGTRIETEKLFSSDYKKNNLNYQRAFLHPPHKNNYTGTDFVKVNAALFPNGTDALEVYEWTTDWSDYFEDGHEWWGTLCLTVYDKTLDRFAVIMASATD